MEESYCIEKNSHIINPLFDSCNLKVCNNGPVIHLLLTKAWETCEIPEPILCAKLLNKLGFSDEDMEKPQLAVPSQSAAVPLVLSNTDEHPTVQVSKQTTAVSVCVC